MRRYYPSLTLSASGGFASSAISKLFNASSRVWSIGPSVSETVFDAGLRRATIEQYTATYNADVATYRQTVLTAFQQVEDYLAQTRLLWTEIQQEEAAVNAAQKAYDLEKARYETGHRSVSEFADDANGFIGYAANSYSICTFRR